MISDPQALYFLMTEPIYAIEGQMDEPAGVRPAGPVYDGFNYLGENNKYILLLVNASAGEKIIEEDELDALKKMLWAKKWALQDVAIVNYRHYPEASLDQLKSFFACSKLIVFEPLKALTELYSLPLNIIREMSGIEILATYNWAEMLADVEKKKEFWSVMKRF